MSRNLSNEGKRNAARAQSSLVSLILNDNINCRTELERRGIKPKNHHRDNLQRIKEICKQNKEIENQQIIEKQLKNKRFTLNKFANVESKVKIDNTQPINNNNNNNNNNINSSRNNNNNDNNSNKPINYVLQNKKNLKNMSNNDTLTTTSTTTHNNNNIEKYKRKDNLPSKEELNRIDLIIKNNHNNNKKSNYILSNRSKAINSKPDINNKEEMRYVNKENYGKIPDYIIERRLQLAEKHKNQLLEKEKAKIPKGMKQMGNEEREETLQLLYKNKKEIENSIEKLPLRVETASMIKYENNLRKQLKEIEDAIKIFSKKIVYIVDNAPNQSQEHQAQQQVQQPPPPPPPAAAQQSLDNLV